MRASSGVVSAPSDSPHKISNFCCTESGVKYFKSRFLEVSFSSSRSCDAMLERQESMTRMTPIFKALGPGVNALVDLGSSFCALSACINDYFRCEVRFLSGQHFVKKFCDSVLMYDTRNCRLKFLQDFFCQN